MHWLGELLNIQQVRLSAFSWRLEEGVDESGNKVPDLAKARATLPSLVSVVATGKRTLLAHARLQLLLSYAGPSGQLGPGAKSKNRLVPRTWAAGLPQQRPQFADFRPVSYECTHTPAMAPNGACLWYL